MRTWARGSFDISTENGARRVDGYVRDGIGVHRSLLNCGWTLTHIRSGMAFKFGVRTATKARAIADAVLVAVPEFAACGEFGKAAGIPQVGTVSCVINEELSR